MNEEDEASVVNAFVVDWSSSAGHDDDCQIYEIAKAETYNCLDASTKAIYSTSTGVEIHRLAEVEFAASVTLIYRARPFGRFNSNNNNNNLGHLGKLLLSLRRRCASEAEDFAGPARELKSSSPTLAVAGGRTVKKKWDHPISNAGIKKLG